MRSRDVNSGYIHNTASLVLSFLLYIFFSFLSRLSHSGVGEMTEILFNAATRHRETERIRRRTVRPEKYVEVEKR